ncbi:NAD(P)-dependent oxidoreductase [Nocardiopsis potens]|uniref:NAD(P)-dependent oxidoreductase n=1 Tax=Nocardiopsis potens TaxID=1246458 RepID=UPI00037917BB|nr:NAD(P)-binding domain-containing protein [Nocardiopsis potens]
MNATETSKPRISLLGLGTMGTALARAWLAAGHPVTVWNRTAARAEPLAAEGAETAATAAEAVAAGDLVVTCLLDDASVGEALAAADLSGKDLVDLTTGTPEQARAREAWAHARGARFLSGGIMAVPPMIGVPESGGYVFYSGAEEVFAEHRGTLAVPAGTTYAGADAGAAALYDVALLSAMNGMFAGVTHAFALVRKAEMPIRDFASLLADWLTALAPAIHTTAEQLDSGDYTTGVVSNLAMQAAGVPTLLRTAEDEGVDTALVAPYLELMERRVAEGHGDEEGAGMIDMLRR